MPSCRGFRVPVVAAAAVVAVFAHARAESWSQSGEATLTPFQVMSTLKPSYSLLSADSATATDGAYSTSDDGATSLAEITSGAWDTTAGPLVLGGGNNTDGTALGKYTVRLTGSGTSLTTAALSANFGDGRLEILDGASVDACGNVQFGVTGTGAKISSTQTVVVVDSTFVLTGASMTLGYRNASYPSSLGYGFLYATNATFSTVTTASYPYFYFKHGRYVFKDSTLDGCAKDYGFNVQIGAEVVIDGSTFTTARYRIGDGGFSHSDGSPTMTMLSGSLATDKFHIGVGNSSVTSILHQVGGTIEINGDIALSTSTQPARLQLCGGTLLT